MYKCIEKLKQTDNDNDQDTYCNHNADKILPDNTAMSTPLQTLENSQVDLAPKSVTPTVKNANQFMSSQKWLKLGLVGW